MYEAHCSLPCLYYYHGHRLISLLLFYYAIVLNDGDNNNIINVISTAQKVSRVWSNQSYFTTILRN